jgi:hypothetical protein
MVDVVLPVVVGDVRVVVAVVIVDVDVHIVVPVPSPTAAAPECGTHGHADTERDH